MNVSTPPKHRWQPVEYKHVEPDKLTKMVHAFGQLAVSSGLLALTLENYKLRAQLGVFDDATAHMFDTIEVKYVKPPRMSMKLDGLEIAHLLAADPEPNLIPADDDYPINRATVTFHSKKLIVKGDYDD